MLGVVVDRGHSVIVLSEDADRDGACMRIKQGLRFHEKRRAPQKIKIQLESNKSNINDSIMDTQKGHVLSTWFLNGPR
jgi:hypothetical protein